MASDNRVVLVTGVLGGLGSSLASELLKRGITVHGLDNYSPLSAPFMHFDYVRTELESSELFRFTPCDLREKSVAGELLSTVRANYTVHCARGTHFNQSPVMTDLYSTVDAAVMDLISDQNLTLYLPGYQGYGSGKPYLNYLADEDQLFLDSLGDRDGFAKVNYLPLPLLMGPGQSLRSYPLDQIWSMVSRTQVALEHVLDGTLTTDLQTASSFIANLIETNQNRETAAGSIETFHFPQEKPFRVKFNLALLFLADKLGIPLREAFGEFDEERLCGNNRSDSEFVSLDQTQIDVLSALTQWALDLPHFPPIKWQKPAKAKKKKK